MAEAVVIMAAILLLNVFAIVFAIVVVIRSERHKRVRPQERG
jgi:hypothetical protein